MPLSQIVCHPKASREYSFGEWGFLTREANEFDVVNPPKNGFLLHFNMTDNLLYTLVFS